MDIFDILSEPENKPLQFLRADKSTQSKVLEALKCQYDSLKIQEKLDSLVVDDFTSEQIWQQVDLVNEKLEKYVKEVAFDVATKDEILIPVKVVQVNDISEDVESKNEDESEGDEDKDEDFISEDNKHYESENEPDSESEEKQDKFFDLKEMEKFVDQEMSDGSDGIDMFQDLPSASESEEENPNYKKFFDNKKNEKKSESDESDSEIEINKSSFEKRNEKLKQRIEKLEDEAIQEKAWPLKGEVDAKGRPVNSLLEEYLEFDMTQRPAPIITEEVTLKLEDIILKRIKDKVYDDVERKIKPVLTPHELKKSIVLDQEKSKLSLAQVYEKEYLNQKSKQEGTEATEDQDMTEEKKKIDLLMKTLFKQLDTLSNFHYTPKLIDAEVKIISTTPAIMVEEVAPIGTSDANVLAPGEVAGEFKRQLTGKDERTATDKKRERRKKKALQSKKAKWRIMKGLDKTKTSFSKADQLEKSDSNALKSSTKFFTKLQEEVQNQIKSNKRTLSGSNKKDLSAKKFKL